jgi:hypothetical protein
MMTDTYRFNARTIVQSACFIGLALAINACTSKDVGTILPQIAPKDQMFTTYGGNTTLYLPTTFRDGSKSFAQRKQNWHFNYFGSWEKSQPDPSAWSMFIPFVPQQKLQPGEIKMVINGKPMVCGNKVNDKLHPMHDYYLGLSSNRIVIRNAKLTDFGCEKTYQDIWNYLDKNTTGMPVGQSVLHTYCTVEYLGNLSRAGFTEKGPYKCRFILKHYMQGTQDKADIQVTVYTEMDSQFSNMDDTHLNIYMKEVGVKHM